MAEILDFKLRIIYEDNHLLVVEKLPGILVQGDSTKRTTLIEVAKRYIKEKYKKPGNVFLGIVHRLDRVTSGIVVFARTSKSAKRLSESFRERKIEKIYLAICEGNMEKEEGKLRNWLSWDENKHKTQIFDNLVPQSKEALTYYKVLNRFKNLSLVLLLPQTGRKHQLRVQLSHIGHPILGDKKYNAKRKFIKDYIALHCFKLKLEHPIKKEIMEFKINPPSFWNNLFPMIHEIVEKI
ncbi:MAG: RluA family pseudouridine synthase [Dictyoglomaceae bacterium]|nr:RluA family pseudouridine synthase [Dictyoglomaceae bacterium]